MKRYLEYWYQKYRDLKLAEKMIIVYVLMLGICFSYKRCRTTGQLQYL